MIRVLHAALLIIVTLLTACSGNELVGVHIKLAKDGTGTVTTRSLVEPTAPGPAETAAAGVSWQARASVQAALGTFRQLDDVKLGGDGLRFKANLGGDQPSIRVYLTRGPGAAWANALIKDQATRRQMAQVYDPSGRTREVGDVIRLELEVPGDVVASSVHPVGRGVEAERERKRAFLLLPARTVLTAGEEMVWDVTWR